jgi:hypothetical protein
MKKWLRALGAGNSSTISGEFFVPFLVLLMYHEHKESPREANILRKLWGLRAVPGIRRRFMPMKPMPTIPILSIA